MGDAHLGVSGGCPSKACNRRDGAEEELKRAEEPSGPVEGRQQPAEMQAGPYVPAED